MAEQKIDPEMIYYKGMSLRNFRGFRKSGKVPLAPLTFLVGPNSSGKSSLFGALLLLAQSNFNPFYGWLQQPQWGGPLIDLGSYKDSVFKHQLTLPIKITVSVVVPHLQKRAGRKQIGPNVDILFSMRTTENDQIGRLDKIEITDSITGEKVGLKYSKRQMSIEIRGRKHIEKYKGRPRHKGVRYYHSHSMFLRDVFAQVMQSETTRLAGRKTAIHRIEHALGFLHWPIIDEVERVSSGRAGPRRWYSIAELAKTAQQMYFGTRVFSEVDPRMLGELTQYKYYRRGRRKPWRRKPPIESIGAGLKKLGIGSSIQPSQLSPYHSAINVRDNVTGITSNLIDVGYGASQVIPILRAAMSPSRGPLFVEQPEIHLHPQAQGTLAEILCEVSNSRQVVIETHSVHVLNRARILVAEGKMDSAHVMINFVGRSKAGSVVHPIQLLDNGDFATEWPSGYGFFDERYQDTMRLLALKNREMNK